jgi:thiamine-monophosphate kinase
MIPETAVPSEFELIRRYFQRGGAHTGVILGIGDDAALLSLPPETELVAAVDTIVAGRHFPHDAAAHSIGHRALAVNLSDLAAMGAVPAWATLALTLPSADAAWLEAFSAGLFELAEANGVALVGGDTTRGDLTVSVQLMGYVPRGTALLRSGARSGDLLVVTGTLGDAGAGLAIATAPPAAGMDAAARELLRRFEYPTPRVQFGLAARGLASAAIDLSDGLVGDLPKLAHASNVAAHVAVERLPLSDAMRASVPADQARDWALAAGDDYELLLSVPVPRYAELAAAAQRLNLRLSAIGEIRGGGAVTWSLNGAEFTPGVQGWDHFAQASTQITV